MTMLGATLSDPIAAALVGSFIGAACTGCIHLLLFFLNRRKEMEQRQRLRDEGICVDALEKFAEADALILGNFRNAIVLVTRKSGTELIYSNEEAERIAQREKSLWDAYSAVNSAGTKMELARCLLLMVHADKAAEAAHRVSQHIFAVLHGKIEGDPFRNYQDMRDEVTKQITNAYRG